MKNPYRPILTKIEKVTVENEAKDLKTFQLVFCNEEEANDFRFQCGQFAELTVLGVGECPIGIASSPMDKAFLEFTVKRYPDGLVTNALHNCRLGDKIGVRGPLGNSFPMEKMEGKNVVFVGGGFAFTTLRSTIKYMLHEDNRSKFGNLTLVYGARSPGELLYKEQLKEWEALNDIETHITVDKGDENWKGKEGFVPAVLDQVAPSPNNAVVLVCGPPIMLKFTLPVLTKLGFGSGEIVTSLEMRMKCGIGLCGRCNIGSKYVCRDGPVFTFEQLQALPAEM
ncbi:MAG: heterodisulfide reductase subunit F [Planctomycetes bacterium]|nr:heterodisulfide reductase subunit F [Planctomycetota bacterium]